MAWQTRDEMTYINGLVSGRYKEVGFGPADPVFLLKNYVKSARKRLLNGTFGGVNGGRVIEYAKERLRELENNPAGGW